MKMHILHTKSFNIPVSIALATLAHMTNVYEICLNTTNSAGFTTMSHTAFKSVIII